VEYENKEGTRLENRILILVFNPVTIVEIERLTIKSQALKTKNVQKSSPPMTNSIQMLKNASEGDGENSKASPTTLAKKS
jgi:hypothetical protein